MQLEYIYEVYRFCIWIKKVVDEWTLKGCFKLLLITHGFHKTRKVKEYLNGKKLSMITIFPYYLSLNPNEKLRLEIKMKEMKEQSKGK